MSLRTSLKFFLLFALCLAAPLQSFAQGTGATVRGTVADPDEAVIPGATVTFTPANGKATVVTSQADGGYTVRNLPAGTYSLTVTMSGFATFVKQGIRINPGQNLIQDAKMAIQVQSEEVQVNAQSVQLSTDPDSNASATTIKGKDLDALSDDPDELSSELSALAGPAAGPNGGQIYVDGFTGGQLPPKSSIREIRINQNPFSAQYDKLGYGRVEVFTKPGTDKFHGNISVQGGARQFNTSNPFLGAANNQPDYHRVFIIGSVSGPINRFSSFTVGGSHRDIQNNSIVNPSGFYATTASSTTPCPPGYNPACSYFSSYPESARAVFNPQTRSDLSPRVDLALGEKNTLTVRYQYYVNGTQNNGIGNTGLPTAGYNSESSENTIQISDTQLVRSNIVNETRFEYERDRGSQIPLSTAPTLSVQGIFTSGGSANGTSTSTENHIELQNYTSIQLPKNFIRVGGRLRTTAESLTSTAHANGTFTYSYLLDPCTDPNPSITRPSACAPTATIPCLASNVTGSNYISSYQCGRPSQFTQAKINNPTVNTRMTDVGLYAEDDWKPRPNLTISYGLRFEAQNHISSGHDIAPRASFAYGIPRKGGQTSTVIRGGYGLFYDRFKLSDVLTTFQENGLNQVTSTSKNPGVGCQPSSITNCGTGSTQRTTYSLGQNLRSSYTMQSAVGLDQQIGRVASMSVNYLYGRGLHQYLSRVYVDPTAYDYQFQSGGVFREHQLMVNGNVRMRAVSLFGFYSLNFANANTSGSGFFPTTPIITGVTTAINTHADYGRASFAHKNFVIVGGNWTLPHNVSFGPFLLAQSGTPYNATLGTDPNSDTIYNERPYFAKGAAGSCFHSSDFTSVQSGSLTPVPINYCTGPANVSFNLRVSKTIGFGPQSEAAQAAAARAAQGGGRGGPGGGRGGRGGPGGGGPGGGPGGFGGGASTGHRYNLNLGAQASNLFNNVNYGTPTSTLTSPRFGQFTTLAGGPFSNGAAVRQFILQASFNF